MNPTVSLQCEEFINEILAREPDKEQLYFCLGLINYNVKRDYSAAIRDLERFNRSSVADRYPEEVRMSEMLIVRSKENA